jgi:hypothetical protein
MYRFEKQDRSKPQNYEREARARPDTAHLHETYPSYADESVVELLLVDSGVIRHCAKWARPFFNVRVNDLTGS